MAGRLVNSTRLMVFQEVATHLSFSLAAKILYMSQPAVSAHVKALEKNIGVSLFTHRRRGLQLTPAGQTLLTQARRLLALEEEAEATVREGSGPLTGQLAIGVGPSWERQVTAVLIDFQRCNPGVNLSIRQFYSQAIVEGIVENRLNLGFVSDAPRDPRLVVTVIGEQESLLTVLVAANHPLAQLRGVHPAQLEGYSFVHYPSEPAGSNLPFLEHLGIRPSFVMQVEGNENIELAVAAGIGISIRRQDRDHISVVALK